MPPQSSATPVATATPAPTRTVAAGHVLQGDVDCSGAVTTVDALIELPYIAGLVDLAPCFEAEMTAISGGGDVDCSGSITAVDALKILRFVAGITVYQREPCPDIGSSLD